MKVVVPLAGPDFVRPDGTLKATLAIDGEPLLLRVLNSRPWRAAVRSQDYAFVFHDRAETRHFAETTLRQWFPGAAVAFVTQHTRGAALSTLGGCLFHKTHSDILIVDLADIIYRTELDAEAVFAADPKCGGVALTFRSDNPLYSYLRLDQDGEFVEAAEKRVISDQASAGTYLFANTAVFLRALAFALENERGQTYNDLFFVCPLFNGVRDQGRAVRLSSVSDVVDIKVEHDRP